MLSTGFHRAVVEVRQCVGHVITCIYK
jgi:hypothetical protein